MLGELFNLNLTQADELLIATIFLESKDVPIKGEIIGKLKNEEIKALTALKELPLYMSLELCCYLIANKGN